MPDYKSVLVFDSRFESGNLHKASKVHNSEYNLWLNNDTYTRGHTQWFYFKILYTDVKVRADKTLHAIKFNIMNLQKPHSLYEDGMRILAWSKRRYEQNGSGWFRAGLQIRYDKNRIPGHYQVCEAS